jgi:hypothetical protein
MSGMWRRSSLAPFAGTTPSERIRSLGQLGFLFREQGRFDSPTRHWQVVHISPVDWLLRCKGGRTHYQAWARLNDSQEAHLKIVTVAAAAAAIAVAFAWSLPLTAQNAPDKGKEHTKVYAYKKAAPTAKQDAPAARPSRQADPDVIPHGTPGWWRSMERLFGGEGGAQ